MVSADDLKIGAVVDIRDPYSFDDKHKYSIIVGISEDKFTIATVFINSLVNPNAIVDCSQIIDRIQITLLDEINASGRLLGQINKPDLKTIINLIVNAPSIQPYYLKLCNIKPI